MLDYGARMHDPELGRWFGVDPLAEKYYQQSPYNYVYNDPVVYVDPNGLEVSKADWDEFLRIIDDMEKEANSQGVDTGVSQSAENAYTKYFNRMGELLYETSDGLSDIIIVGDGNIQKLKTELQAASDNGTINDPETNKQELHKLGRTPLQYKEDAYRHMDSDFGEGYRVAYESAFAGESTFGVMSSYIIAVVGSGGQGDSGPRHKQGGAIKGRSEGKQDRKAGIINRLNPSESLKNNPPLIKLLKLNMNQGAITFPYPGKGLPPEKL